LNAKLRRHFMKSLFLQWLQFVCIKRNSKCSVTRRVQPTGCDVSQFICFCKTLCMFQTFFPSIIRSSKLHIQRQVCVRTILLPAASLARLAAGSSNGLTNNPTLYVQFRAPDDGRKSRLKHVEHHIEISKLTKVATCWLHSENILANHGPTNVKYRVLCMKTY